MPTTAIPNSGFAAILYVVCSTIGYHSNSRVVLLWNVDECDLMFSVVWS